MLNETYLPIVLWLKNGLLHTPSRTETWLTINATLSGLKLNITREDFEMDTEVTYNCYSILKNRTHDISNDVTLSPPLGKP